MLRAEEFLQREVPVVVKRKLASPNLRVRLYGFGFCTFNAGFA